MLKYSGQTCPVCHKTFTDTDDVVVCPECGTPHHRVCYQKNGQCINTPKHGSFDWGKDERVTPVEETFNPKKEVGYICPRCGTNNHPEALFCENCQLPRGGNPQDYKQQPIMGQGAAFQTENNPYGHVDVDGVDAADLAIFVDRNTQRYIPKFIKNRKIGWNWGAFIFGPLWFLYRKMTSVGLVLLVLFFAFSVASNAMLEPVADDVKALSEAITRESNMLTIKGGSNTLSIQHVVNEVQGSQKQPAQVQNEQESTIAESTTETPQTTSPSVPTVPSVPTDTRSAQEILQSITASSAFRNAMIVMAVYFVVHICFVLFADKIYRSHCIKNIKTIKETDLSGMQLQTGMIEMHGVSLEEVYMRSRGGVNFFLPLVGIFVFTAMENIWYLLQ